MESVNINYYVNSARCTTKATRLKRDVKRIFQAIFDRLWKQRETRSVQLIQNDQLCTDVSDDCLGQDQKIKYGNGFLWNGENVADIGTDGQLV